MSSRPNIDDLFKKELDGLQHEYSESLWQKLDVQLQSERDAYHKKDKKRRAAWLVLPLLLVLGGGTVWYFANSSSSGKTDIVAAKNTPAASENNTKVQSQQTAPAANPAQTADAADPSSNNLPAVSHTQKQPGIAPANNNANNNTSTISEPVNQPTTSVQNNNTVVRRTRGRETGNENTHTPNTPNIVRAAAEQLRITPSKNNMVVRRAKKDKTVTDKPVGVVIDKQVETEETVPPAETVKQEKEIVAKQQPPVVLVETAPVTPEEKAEPAPVAPVETAKANTLVVKSDKDKLATAKATSKTPKPGNSFAVSVIGGTNLSSPFRKPGVYGGALFTKTIGDKHIFAGLKIASNQLDHQLISAAKSGQPSPETDAVIQKLTILEMPFGYEFALGQKKAKRSTTFLQVGFEPAYITGLRTLFYDDQGIPGGPRQEVVNSPLMAKAVNRFNLLFVAGIRKQVTPRIGLLFTGGYSLIDITDKQYYNRTSTNNNLKYVQAGLLFRLNK